MIRSAAVACFVLSLSIAAQAASSSVRAACGSEDFPDRKAGRIITLPSGVWVQTQRRGFGRLANNDDVVWLNYRGTISNGTQFDENWHAALPVNAVVAGFGVALKQMQAGGRYRICVPATLAYGEKSPMPAIPANAALRFDIEAFEIVPMTEARRRFPSPR